MQRLRAPNPPIVKGSTDTCVCVCVCVYLLIMRSWLIQLWTQKSHDLPSTSWRPGKARGVIQTKAKGMETRREDGANFSLRARKDEMRCSSSRS